jgi:hypothetical protein
LTARQASFTLASSKAGQKYQNKLQLAIIVDAIQLIHQTKGEKDVD